MHLGWWICLKTKRSEWKLFQIPIFAIFSVFVCMSVLRWSLHVLGLRKVSEGGPNDLQIPTYPELSTYIIVCLFCTGLYKHLSIQRFSPRNRLGSLRFTFSMKTCSFLIMIWWCLHNREGWRRRWGVGHWKWGPVYQYHSWQSTPPPPPPPPPSHASLSLSLSLSLEEEPAHVRAI